MDGTPTEDARTGGRRRRTLTVVGIAAVGALAAGGVLFVRASDHHVAPTVAEAVAPVVPARPLPSVATSSPPAAPTIPHDVVPAAVPTAFTLAGPAFTIKARVCSMPPVFPLDPPGEQHHTVCWVQKGFGVRPGTGSGTSYILGHSWAEDDQEVLNRLSAPVTREILAAGKPVMRDGVPIYPAHAVDGYRLTLRTPAGTLVYKVRDAFAVAKDQLGNMAPELDAKVKNRVVLITCAERAGTDYDFNIVLNAYLWSSKAAAARTGT